MTDQVAQMRNHWWWRPGWRVGRSFYTWYVTFADQPEVHRLATAYASILHAVASLDPISPRRLHLTMQGVGFTDEVNVKEWRNPARQIRLVRVLAAEPVTLVPLDGFEARAVGQLCAASETTDVADASVALLGRRTGGIVVTSDPVDLRRIDPGLDLVEC